MSRHIRDKKHIQRLAAWEQKARDKALRALKRELHQQWRDKLAAEREDGEPLEES